MNPNILQKTIADLAIAGKGILAADESTGTIQKRFATIHVESTEENRRQYRELLFTTPELNRYISGIILFEETLFQKTKEGIPFSELLAKHNIVPGIKVDKGLIPSESASNEKVTQGLDGLSERLIEYKKQGARFAKWRAVYAISADTPSSIIIKTNATLLARYAAICQNQDIVPIVEPEILMDGSHTLAECEVLSEHIFHSVFHALHQHGVQLEHMILKPSMVISGNRCVTQASVTEVAERTVRILKRTVPAAVPSINFLSGGQTDKLATQHLNAMNQLAPLPWLLSFSYGRALQTDALNTWKGNAANIEAAQQALLKRAKLNGLAAVGQYQENME